MEVIGAAHRTESGEVTTPSECGPSLLPDATKTNNWSDEMIFDIGSEIRQTNRAYCAAHGMAAGELYGTAPTVAEMTTHRLMAAGVPSEAADPYVERMEAERLRMRKLIVNLQHKIRLQNVGYTTTPFKRLVNRENYINRGIA